MTNKSNEVFGNSTDVNETIAQESGLAKETPTTDSKTATAKAAKAEVEATEGKTRKTRATNSTTAKSTSKRVTKKAEDVKEEAKTTKRTTKKAVKAEETEVKPVAKKTTRKYSKKVEKSLYIQHGGNQVDEAALYERVIADCESQGVAVSEIKLYVKPEDNACYYVANGNTAGKVDLY